MTGLSLLPPLNASLNALSALLLIAGFVMIRTGRREAHRACMTAALGVSILFLISYVVYHAQAGLTRYQGLGWTRTVYLTILLTHEPLAACVPFLAIWTFIRASQGRFDLHRRIARVTYPIWLYVSVTGVIIYLMLRSSYGTT